jgi:hypothetical protein
MQDRIGVAMRPRAASLDRELDLLRRLGRLPVFLRFHHHETREQWDFTASVARRLHAEGHRVSAGLLQDRRAVLEPSSWRAFVAYVLGRVGDAAEWVECGHAINRVKWGLWDFREYGELMRGVADAGALHPAARLMGPAVIDFEYPFVTAALQHLPAGMRFHALSHHLYVDRRGAPESEQHGFSAVEKFALARAIARRSAVCDDRLVVSEVNWPIRGTGVYSPVNSPYESTGVRFNDPSVSEDNYADYMIRYLLLAVCSGMVERVFWWRLVARGFGLVDDTDPHAWRERPAYAMLRVFLARLGGATFSRRTGGGKRGDSAGIHAFCFVLPDGAETCVAYSTRGEVETALPFEVGEVRDAFDCAIQPEARRRSVVRLSGRPVYLLGDQPASRSR